MQITERLEETVSLLDNLNADEATKRAGKYTDQLKKLNGSIFKPVIGSGKRVDLERPGQTNYHREKRPGNNLCGDSFAGERNQLLGRGTSRFNDGTNRDDEMSDENLDEEVSGNLDEILKMTRCLKGIGLEMGEELGRQSVLLDKLGADTLEA